METSIQPKRARTGAVALGAPVQAGIHVAEHRLTKNNFVLNLKADVAKDTGQHGKTEFLGAEATAHRGEHICGASARAGVANAMAVGTGIPGCGGLAAPLAFAEVAEASASAQAGVLGAKADFNATVGRVTAGLASTPIMVSAEGPGGIQ